MIKRSLVAWIEAGLAVLLAAPAMAGSGQPSPKQLGFQDAVTPVAEQIQWVHDYVNSIIFVITAFVLVLLLFVMWRFSEKRNPTMMNTARPTAAVPGSVPGHRASFLARAPARPMLTTARITATVCTTFRA